MKQFRIDVSHASPGQLQTIAAELKIMSNAWTKFGPRIMINIKSFKLQASGYPDQAASMGRETASRKPQA